MRNPRLPDLIAGLTVGDDGVSKVEMERTVSLGLPMKVT